MKEINSVRDFVNSSGQMSYALASQIVIFYSLYLFIIFVNTKNQLKDIVQVHTLRLYNKENNSIPLMAPHVYCLKFVI